MATPGIIQSTRAFERWLSEQIPTVRADFERKHERMRENPFVFLRATFYRWMELWPQVCPELDKAPRLLAVGDLHLENFGTWRDAEGRLAWGINDFDEAYPLPYTLDLARLATSAALFTRQFKVQLKLDAACTALLGGYAEGLERGGEPFVLEERHDWLRELVLLDKRTPAEFWAPLQALPAYRGKIPAQARKLLGRNLPPGLKPRIDHRVAGLGSLGRLRLVGLGEWQGGLVARETKPLAPSAATWTGEKAEGIYYSAMLENAVRAPDPALQAKGGWLVRRLAPDNVRVELNEAHRTRIEEKLFHAMGLETANVHLGNHKAVKSVRKDLRSRKRNWLLDAAEAMAEASVKDFEVWKRAK